MLKFVEKMGGMIHCRQHFKHGNIFPFREESSKRQAFHLFLFGSAHMEAAVSSYCQVRVFAIYQVLVGFLIPGVKLFF
jgi:hypothetical protein